MERILLYQQSIVEVDTVFAVNVGIYNALRSDAVRTCTLFAVLPFKANGNAKPSGSNKKVFISIER